MHQATDVYHVYMSSESEEMVHITYRVPKSVADRLKDAAPDLPALPGSKPTSIHQAARAFMLDGLEAHEEKEEE